MHLGISCWGPSLAQMGTNLGSRMPCCPSQTICLLGLGYQSRWRSWPVGRYYLLGIHFSISWAYPMEIEGSMTFPGKEVFCPRMCHNSLSSYRGALQKCIQLTRHRWLGHSPFQAVWFLGLYTIWWRHVLLTRAWDFSFPPWSQPIFAIHLVPTSHSWWQGRLEPHSCT